MRCGLLGRRLAHSYSPQIHSHLGSYSYDLFPTEPENLESFLETDLFEGLNVTVPYKKAVIPYCQTLTPIAEKMGAVNTIVRQPDGSLLGHNTDFFGFQTMVRYTGLSVAEKKALVLGSGGASNTAVAVLEALGAEVMIISRTGKNNYQNLHLHADASLIVNATPVGMFPDNGTAPLSLSGFPQLEGVLDIIYNPARTALLLEAENRGLVTANGLEMLVAQAWESAQWFTGQPIGEEKLQEIYHLLRNQMENMILIGMPGCGKSTVGHLLAEKTGKFFVDVDEAIVQKAGLSIPEIFEQQGETAFRALETSVLSELGKQSGLVIATGGGCVTREENYPLLHQNGHIFCLERDLNALPIDGRPLSRSTALSELYRVRKPLYDRFADVHVDNDGTAESTVSKILTLWEDRL